MKRTFLLGLLVAGLAHAEGVKRATFPSPSPDGKWVAFSYQGDLWVGPGSGGEARRITVHAANDAQPRWLPDGSRILFTSDRYGSSDFFSIKPDGSDLKRLNYDSSAETLSTISADGKWIYGHSNAWGRGNAIKLSTSGGDLIRLTEHPLEVQHLPSVSRDGSMIAFCNGSSAGAWRKPLIKGANTGEIWVAQNAAPVANAKNITKNEASDLFPMFAPDNTIYFVSNRAGFPNLWKMNADGSGAKKLTNHEFGTLRWPSMSADGSVITYEHDSGLYSFDVKSGKSTPLNMEVTQDARTNPMIELAATSGASDFAVSTDGKRAVVGVRGDLYLIPEKGGTTRKLTSSVAMDANPVWLDAKTILFQTGRTGKRELWTVDINGNEKVFYKDSVLDAMNPLLSPDGKTVLFNLGDRQLMSIPATGGTAKLIVNEAFPSTYYGGYTFDWSPDGKWIVMDAQKMRGSTVDILNVETGKRVTVAVTARGGTNPRWLPTGKAVYFVADGDDQGEDLFMVDLVAPEVTFSEDDLDKIDEKPAEKKDDGKTEVDERGLLDRIRRVARSVSAPVALNSSTIYANVDGVFSMISVASGATTPVAGITGPAVLTVQNKKGYVSNAGRLLAMAGPGFAPISFNAVSKIDSREEEKALYSEIIWALERLYYDSNMHGVKWQEIKARYAELVPHVTDRTDFYALMGEFVEELDSSHQGATAPATAPTGSRESVGWLGAEWVAADVEKGVYRVKSILDGTPASHPTNGFMIGDVVTAVDGVKPSAMKPMSLLLNGKTGQKVKFSITRGGKDIEVLVKPTSAAALSSVNYENWVKWNRDQVEKLSGGKLTYHHIQGMDEASYQRFLREIRTLTNDKKGLVIDVRYNGGGSTSHKILGVLIKTPWLYRTMRVMGNKNLSENIYRGDSLELPSALLTNQYSFSNAEIMSEGFQRLKVGPVVGERTGGGVIGTSAFGLWDGGMIRMPAIGCFTIDGENLERNGRKPNFNVMFDPNMWHQGRDPQLEKAVQELLKKVK